MPDREKRKRGAPKGNRNALKHGFYARVLDEAEKLVARFSRDYPQSSLRMHHQLLEGRVLDAKGGAANYKRAAELFQNVLSQSKIARTQSLARFHLARTLQRLDDHKRVLEAVGPLADELKQDGASPELAEALVVQGISFFALKQYEQAGGAMAQYLELRPNGRQADQALSFFEDIAGMVEQIHTATQEQTRGSEQIIKVSEKMKQISIQVKKATREQALGGRQISHAIEHITEISTYINNSQAEQRKAAYQVLEAISTIADIAHQNVEGVEKVTESVKKLGPNPMTKDRSI